MQKKIGNLRKALVYLDPCSVSSFANSSDLIPPSSSVDTFSCLGHRTSFKPCGVPKHHPMYFLVSSDAS